MSNPFTRREKHVLVFLALLFPVFFFVEPAGSTEGELFWLVLVVLPLGIYLLTDKERREGL